jgi:hypothetical protein
MRDSGLAIGTAIDDTRIEYMPINDSTSDQQRPAEHKKPYEKPAFRYEQVFVTTALGCTKVHRTGRSCAPGKS